MGMEFVFLNGDVRVGGRSDGSILIGQRKQRVRRWRFNMVFPDGDFFFCHPLWKDPLIVRGVCCFHINGFFSILFLCFFSSFYRK